MKLVVFNQYRIGVLENERVYDVTSFVPEQWQETPYAMNQFISNYQNVKERILTDLYKLPSYEFGTIRLLPPVPSPGQILAAPSNYHKHIAEMTGSSMSYSTRGTPRTLGLFWKSPGSICGPSDEIKLPPLANRRFDHEAELGVVIGKEASGVKEADAYSYVFGYTGLMDITLRMTETEREERTMRKSFSTFTPIGPVLVTADEIANPEDLMISLRVGGQLRQQASTKDMIAQIPELIAIGSSVVTLQPGDIIATGTPEGIGEIKQGDIVELEIEKVGVLRLPVQSREW